MEGPALECLLIELGELIMRLEAAAVVAFSPGTMTTLERRIARKPCNSPPSDRASLLQAAR